MSVAWMAYRAATTCLGLLAPAARIFAPPPERALWSERMGAGPGDGRIDAWLHAASMGEAMAAAALAQELAAFEPSARLLLTATTRGGRSRLAGLGRPTSLAPLDVPQAAGRFFARFGPRRLFLMETELWPNWLLEARRRGVPVAVVSARLSVRSVAQYRPLGSAFRDLVGSLAVLAQTGEDRERWLRLGARADRSVVTGNLKDDALPRPAADRAAVRREAGLDPGRPLLVLGCVRPGELEPLARAWRWLPQAVRDHWQVVAVPRHPRASAEMRGEASRIGQSLSAAGLPPADGAWTWDDRLGVLQRWYVAADVAFVGGSLRPYGGHNPLEPAACGAAVLMGLHHASQADAVRALRERQAIRLVKDEDDLAAGLREILERPDLRARMAEAALVTVEGRRGAARRSVARLAEWGLWPAG